MKLTMHITTYRDWRPHGLNIAFFLKDFFGLLTQPFNLNLVEGLTWVQLRDEGI